MKIAYWWERIYPHVIAVVATVILDKLSIHPLKSIQIDSLIDGIVTLDSIIIGFLGAIIPVIISMKNESKIVKYIFDRDNDGLFKKYILETIAYGLLDVCISLAMYMRDVMNFKKSDIILSAIFLYMFFVFVLSTYRSMSSMLKLLFVADETLEDNVAGKLEEDERIALWDEKGK